VAGWLELVRCEVAGGGARGRVAVLVGPEPGRAGQVTDRRRLTPAPPANVDLRAERGVGADGLGRR
jgi:hypothetical protein